MLTNFYIIVLVCCVFSELSVSTYSNVSGDIRALRKPFRIAKINGVWEKACRKLTDSRLENLYNDLMKHDLEELSFKKARVEGTDKLEVKEVNLRKKLNGILTKYSLNIIDDGIRDAKDKPQNALFKDERLDRLWKKAEKSGFSEKELKVLKQEFQQHQDEVDRYYASVESMSARDSKWTQYLGNDILDSEDDDDVHYILRKKHQALKRNYDRLERKTLSAPNNTEFGDLRITSLWKLASESDFNEAELDSLRVELKHYEKRLEKLNYLDEKLRLLEDVRVPGTDNTGTTKKLTEDKRIILDRFKKQSSKVQQMHEDIETRILQRHTEL